MIEEAEEAGAGHDTAWLRTDSPGVGDAEVLARAWSEDRVLLTFDKDFGSLVFQRGAEASRGVVLFRVVTTSPEAAASFIAHHPLQPRHDADSAHGSDPVRRGDRRRYRRAKVLIRALSSRPAPPSLARCSPSIAKEC